MNSKPLSTPRVWLITGCSRGMGLALASQVLACGQKVIATARDPSTLRKLASLYPDTCRVLALDVSNPAQVKSAVVEATAEFGRLDVVVNNAGYGLVGAFEEFSEEQIHRIFAVNFFGALEVMRAVLPVLREQKSGHIVNISAAAAISNYAGLSIYGATKCALEGVSESLAAELKPLGIEVTIVQPGPFRTGFIGHSLERAGYHLGDYDSSSGRFRHFLESMEGKQPGDPMKAATAIIAAVESGKPPMRLILGKYATEKAHKKITVSESELAAWRSIGMPTDFNP
ncbi:MAG: fabG 8 [Chthoniobacteraceae bacterium]|nr:fabG 8 [Chthoniobacteraceae bacterium]